MTTSSVDERVLVLAPTGRDGHLILAALARAQISAELCTDILDLSARIRQGAGAVLVAEEALGSRGVSILSQTLSTQPTWSDLPLIVSTVEGEITDARIATLSSIGAAGNVTLLERPARTFTLVAMVQTALRARRRQYELRGLTLQIEHERHKLQALIVQAPLPVAILEGSELRFTIANPAYLDMMPDRAVLQQPFLAIFPELEGSELFARMRMVLETGKPYDIPEHLQAVRTKTGERRDRYFRSAYRPLRDAGGRSLGVVIVHLDLTEQVLVRQALEASRSEAVAANRAKDDFMAMLGHELRNPLAPILTALELMTASDEATFAKERSIIRRQANHMARLVEDLLDVSRIASGKIELKPEPVEIAEVLAKAIETATPLLEQAHHELRVNVPSQCLRVHGDVARLVQIFSNLLTNAGKYSDPGGRIEVDASRVDGEVVVHVADHGRGIAADMLPRIFFLFVQERQNLDRSQGGLGLGLSIVKSLVELHGGRVEVRSPGPGRGSTFTIHLPLLTATNQEPPPAPITPVGMPAVRSERAVVLIVDDNEDAAEMLATLIERRGFRARVAFNGDDALALAAELVPNLAILDIGLPNMSGYELAKRLRLLPGWAKVELVALTGYGQPGDRERSAAAGFDRHLVKPIDGRTLQKLLDGAASATA